MQKYLVTGPRSVEDVAPGSEFEFEFSAMEEADHLAAGRLKIVPRKYQVVGGSRVCETEPGGFFSAAFTVDQEAALLGGHIERVDAKPKSKGKEAS